jgi:hypothetical protein
MGSKQYFWSEADNLWVAGIDEELLDDIEEGIQSSNCSPGTPKRFLSVPRY